MDIAIVTGASSSLGLAISRRLIQLGLRVYGLGGDYKDCPLQNVNFRPVPCDLADPAAVEAAALRILEKEKGVFAIVNNAKFFGRNRFSEMDGAELERILRINLLCPLVLVRTLMHSIKELQGYIIQLGAPFAESSSGGPAGAASSGGLRWMGDVLFQELRDHGVKVCHLSPEPNRGRDPRTTARPGARTEASIDPEAVAQAVEQLMLNPFGNVVTEMVLRPLRVRELEQEPVRRLPYPEPKPIPYTVPREEIEAEEQLEEQRYQELEERKLEKRRARKAVKKQASEPAEEPAGEPSDERSGEPARERPAPPPRPAAAAAAPSRPAEQAAPDAAGQGRRRHRRKPRPPKVEVGFLDREKPPAAPQRPEAPRPAHARPQAVERPAAGDTPPPADEAQAARKKPARRRGPRKSAKKTSQPPENGKDSA